MKIEKDIQNSIVVALRKTQDDISANLDEFIYKIENAESVEEIMKLKEQLLIRLIKDFPLGVQTCYFCIKHHFNPYAGEHGECVKCEYGKLHKICTVDDSTYDTIQKARNEFTRALESYAHSNWHAADVYDKVD